MVLDLKIQNIVVCLIFVTCITFYLVNVLSSTSCDVAFGDKL